MTFERDDNCESGVVIRVIGVGGGGNNAVNRMIAAGIRGVEFVTINTDRQALRRSEAPVQMVIGEKITKGFGAGAVPAVGARAAEESMEDIKKMLQGADMVFVTAGMGGGTGTGAAPVVARVAHEMDILTVGIVTKPFSFEGRQRMEKAEKGIQELRQYVDALVVIPNEKLKEASTTKITLSNAFEIADDVLRRGVQSISELINIPGLINLDFADVTTIMKNAGYAHMGMGVATGADKAKNAAQLAIASPLLETSIHGAKGILISITASRDVGLEDVYLASTMIQSEAAPDANVIWGVSFGEDMEDEMRVTIIATGFEKKNEETESVNEEAPVEEPEEQPVAEPVERPAEETVPAVAATPSATEPSVAQPAAKVVPPHPPIYDAEGEDSSISDDEFDSLMNVFRSRGRGEKQQ